MTKVPLFPLRTVLFPGGRLNVRVFEKRYVDMISNCLKTESPFGVCLIKSGAEVGRAADPHTVGTLAHVAHCDIEQPGILAVSARGGGRFRVGATEIRSDQLLMADVCLLGETRAPVPLRHARLVDVLREMASGAGAESHFSEPEWDDAGWMGVRLAELLPLPTSLKQELLEMDEPTSRLDALAEYLAISGGAPNTQ